MFEHVTDNCTCPGKRCPDCKQIKCYGAFNIDQEKASGLQTYCRVCQGERNRAYYRNNREREQARSRTEKKREYARIWRRDNSGYLQEYNRAYKQAHPECIREYYEKNADEHRERAKVHAQNHRRERTIHEENRRARKRQAGGTFTHQEWEALCKYYDYTCLRCGRREPDIELTVDHVIPLYMGGSNSIDNIQPLCRSCNARKRTKTVDYRGDWESRN